MRLIHLSDLHATTRRHSWDYDGRLRRHRTRSRERLALLAAFLHRRRAELAGAPVVITGDVTDRGDAAGHRLAAAFLAALRADGYGVHVVPGNHDWFWKGNRGLDALHRRWAGAFDGSVGRGRRPAEQAPSTPAARFRELAGHPFPHAVDVPGGRLLLLDSLAGHRWEHSSDQLAQGRLGAAQLAWLEAQLTTYQPVRQGGRRLVVCLHHPPLHPVGPVAPSSPLRRDRWAGLREAEALLAALSGRVDAVLFGHSTPAGVLHRHSAPAAAPADEAYRTAGRDFAVPLLHCVNLEHAVLDGPGAHCPVPFIDLDGGVLSVYDACAPSAGPRVQPLGVARAVGVARADSRDEVCGRSRVG